jgi:hypothetical protein
MARVASMAEGMEAALEQVETDIREGGRMFFQNLPTAFGPPAAMAYRVLNPK